MRNRTTTLSPRQPHFNAAKIQLGIESADSAVNCQAHALAKLALPSELVRGASERGAERRAGLFRISKDATDIGRRFSSGSIGIFGNSIAASSASLTLLATMLAGLSN